MNVLFTPTAWEDYQHWVQQSDRKKLKRIGELIRDIQRSPFEGIGKPEALRFNLTGCWSRRITEEHRLVYQLNASGDVVILQCRYHYG